MILLESMCVPDEKPSMLLREEPREEDQSLTDIVYYPSEDSLVKMLYRAHFGLVYRVVPLPDHDDFRDTGENVQFGSLRMRPSICSGSAFVLKRMKLVIRGRRNLPFRRFLDESSAF